MVSGGVSFELKFNPVMVGVKHYVINLEEGRR